MENISEVVVRVPSFETAFLYASILIDCQVCVTTSLNEVLNESDQLLPGIFEISGNNQLETIQQYILNHADERPIIRILITNKTSWGANQ